MTILFECLKRSRGIYEETMPYEVNDMYETVRKVIHRALPMWTKALKFALRQSELNKAQVDPKNFLDEEARIKSDIQRIYAKNPEMYREWYTQMKAQLVGIFGELEDASLLINTPDNFPDAHAQLEAIADRIEDQIDMITKEAAKINLEV